MRNHRSDIAFALFLGVLLYIAWVLRHALLLIYVAMILAIVLTPAVDWLTQWHIGRWQPKRGVGVVLLLVLCAAGATLFVFFAAPPLTVQARVLAQQWPQRSRELAERLHALPFAEKLDVQATIRQSLSSVMSLFSNVGSAVAALIMLVILSAYFIVDGERAFRWFVSFFSPGKAERLVSALGRAEHRISRWIFGQLLLMLILGVVDAVVYGIMGINFFLALSMFAGLMNFIPVVGPMIGLIPAALVAATQSTGKLIAVLAFYGIYQQLDNSYITPRVMRATVNISPLAVVVALIIGAELGGILGAFVAVPTAALVEVLVQEYVINHQAHVRPRSVA
ncbi:MAG TPA: AI-2E family transporter [Terriglobales bacterium]|nr:AI-2E family transporter [Terriglobales bacterium]